MPPFHRLPALILPVLLSACGGGGEPPAVAPAGAVDARRQGLAVALTASAPASGADTVFDWAERQYPALFPAGAATQRVDHEGRRLDARSYPGPANHLGLVSGGTLYGLGAFTQGEVRDLGSFETYLCQASPGECAPRPARVLRVRIDAGSRQCEPGSGSWRLDMRRRLTDAGITVVGSDCGFGNFGVPAACGYGDARYWMFDIDEAQAGQAVALGFKPVDALYYTGQPSALACSY